MSAQELPLPQAQPAEAALMHPCEFIQRGHDAQEEALRMHRIRTTHSLGAAVEVGLTEATLHNTRRLGALPSSGLLYDAHRGRLTQMSFGDVYGLPEHDPRVQPSSRALTERAMYGYELNAKNLGV